MSTLFHRLPSWLAVVPGLLIGWLFAGGGTMVGRDADPATPPSHSGTSNSRGEAGNPSSPQAGISGSAKLRLEPEKLRLLRHCHLDMKLEMTTFGEGEARSTLDAVFEVLRRVLDLTPREESALRDNLTRSADALRTYERDHLTGFAAANERISFQLPAAGKFYVDLIATIARTQKDILGDERAAIFEAITRTDSFCDLPPQFGGAVEFQSSPADRSVRMHIDGEQLRITWISSTPPWDQESIFGRFDHLIDAESKRRFLEATVAGE